MSTQSEQWIATARLLRRTGFGATGPQIDVMAGQDWSTYLDAVLDADPEADPGARATPMPAFPSAPRFPGDDASAAAKDQYNRQTDEQMLELTRWWLRRMVAVREPIHEKLTLLWHNHFATSALKVRYATYMGAQNQKLRTLKLGDFRELAYAMLTDAAMLSWLDGTRQRRLLTQRKPRPRIHGAVRARPRQRLHRDRCEGGRQGADRMDQADLAGQTLDKGGETRRDRQDRPGRHGRSSTPRDSAMRS